MFSTEQFSFCIMTDWLAASDWSVGGRAGTIAYRVLIGQDYGNDKRVSDYSAITTVIPMLLSCNYASG